MIQTITRYRFNGKEYAKLLDVKTNVENQIGAIIDYSDITLTPKQKLNLLATIVANKKNLTNLLNVTYMFEGERFGQDEEKNILDL